MTAAAGPKVSSAITGMSGVTSTRTVGAYQAGPRSSRLPPVRARRRPRPKRHLSLEAAARSAPGQRSDLGVASAGRADDQLLDRCGEAAPELFGDRLVDDEAFGAQAGLAGVEEASRDGLRDDHVEVGVGEDDEGVGAAQFEHALLGGASGAGRDVRPGRLLPVRVTAAIRSSWMSRSTVCGDVGLGDDQRAEDARRGARRRGAAARWRGRTR